MGVRRGGGEMGICPLEIGTKKQKFLANMTLAVQFRFIHLIVAMKVYLLV